MGMPTTAMTTAMAKVIAMRAEGAQRGHGGHGGHEGHGGHSQMAIIGKFLQNGLTASSPEIANGLPIGDVRTLHVHGSDHMTCHWPMAHVPYYNATSKNLPMSAPTPRPRPHPEAKKVSCIPVGQVS